MRHEVLLPIEIDSTAIEQKLEKDGFDIIIDKLIKNIEDNLPKTWSYNKKSPIDWKEFANKAAQQFFEDHKDEVLEAAAMHVATKIQRSKAYQQKIGEITAKMEASDEE